VEGARLARHSDLALLANLWQRAVDDLAGQRGGTVLASDLTRSDLSGSLDSYLVDPGRLVAVGTIDGTPVGIIEACLRPTGDELIAVVELIYVEPEGRQVGVGEAMMGHTVRWARSQGCTSLDAPALPGSRSAKAFFEGHGFQARLLTMHLRLDARP
jgi:GNAT superfamily N-acetyltransferase